MSDDDISVKSKLQAHASQPQWVIPHYLLREALAEFDRLAAENERLKAEVGRMTNLYRDARERPIRQGPEQ